MSMAMAMLLPEFLSFSNIRPPFFSNPSANSSNHPSPPRSRSQLLPPDRPGTVIAPGESQMARILSCLLLLLLLLLLLCPTILLAKTDQPDVSALNVMFNSMNSPSQLSGWQSIGGDPCGHSWQGIECSGSSVTEINLSGLGLSGSMGYQLSSLTSVTYFDMSKNNIQGDIPYQLPPNLNYLNLAGNSFTGGVPYSISQMTDLEYLNLAQNQLSGQLSDMFEKLQKLSELDLSVNRMSGDLPQSFGSLSSLKILNLENNQFTGSINVLAKLSLEHLNVQNNQFSGWIPNKLSQVKEIKTGGNPWSSGNAPPGNTAEENVRENSSGQSRGVIAGIVIALLVIAMVVLVLVKRRISSSSHYVDGKSQYVDDELSQNRSFTPLVSHDLKGEPNVLESTSIDLKSLPSSIGLKPLPPDSIKTYNENEFANGINARQSVEPLLVRKYSFSDLQAATGSFNFNRLLGEGSIGRVYKAKYADGKILAVKKIDTADFSGSILKDFMEVVSDISRLHHSNIAELVGYCMEPGQRLLVYEFQRNGSLYEFLHLSDEYSRPLTWDTRVRIALGTARAIEYLHEICSPCLIHKNIKSANILLDMELNPHLSDCGLTALYQDTSENLGPGYNPPECTKPAAYTLKSDVYSFGVVMLELLTGRKPYDSSKPRPDQILVRWAASQLHDINALAQMVDPGLRGLYPPKSLHRLADVIALCVRPEPEFRPLMSEVVQALALCIQRTGMGGGKVGRTLSSASRRSDWSDDFDYRYY
ncbi:protein STRUBBELIG-RECEPTOR FAMILY 5-like isoform X1 [Dioscorea cayenensis subsp. rotundata]|uniref:Protein STRUBBELIG-RECEPTOR FAMILY 5-like isoform X1 n=1 Tax=Dioscorea cayennensis subsp. rotundata TaxID=55577 RepID=A0AB40BZD4_DIOCR|nr:protein STRUBBELIG-RECEPTOR FAMILY 5-like isoform X1 [Dioscorea cayenensis subsp. rotundata]